jgi:hypothetical protein
VATPRPGQSPDGALNVARLYSPAMTRPKWRDRLRHLDWFNAGILKREREVRAAWDRDRARYSDLLAEADGLSKIRGAYVAADRLGIIGKRWAERVNVVYLVSCFLMAVVSVVFFKVNPNGQRLLLLLPLCYGAFLAGLAAYLANRYFQIKRRFVLVRNLAESLRIRFFWTVAGISPSIPIAPPTRSVQYAGEWASWASTGTAPLDDGPHMLSCDIAIADWVEDQARYYQTTHVQIGLKTKRLNQLARFLFVGFLYAPLTVLEAPLSESLRAQSESAALLLEIAVASIGISLVGFGVIKSYIALFGLEAQHLDYLTLSHHFGWVAKEARSLVQQGRSSDVRPLLIQLGNRAMLEQNMWIHEQARAEINLPR